MGNLIYPFFVSFFLVFISELGDKTQLLVLSFSNKLKSTSILLGVAIGTFFSHGIAILFGSSISMFKNELFHNILEILTCLSFLLFGFLSFLPQKNENTTSQKNTFIKKIANSKLSYIIIIALCIMLGELGDKTFIASFGLGISYPSYKLSLIIGSILGMVASNSIAIIFSKVLNNYISESVFKKISGILFILFGVFSLLCLLKNYF